MSSRKTAHHPSIFDHGSFRLRRLSCSCGAIYIRSEKSTMFVIFVVRYHRYCNRSFEETLGASRKMPAVLSQDNVSHHSDMVLTQLKKRCDASSSQILQNGQQTLFSSTFLHLKLTFVGNLSQINLQAKCDALLGIFSFHSAVNAPS